jgi:hypothetical protein
MGASSSKSEFTIEDALGPRADEVLTGKIEETMPDEDWEEEVPSEWPFESGRLAKVNYKQIIKDGDPWTDEAFKPEASSLFRDGVCHRDALKLSKKRLWNEYEWMRVSDYFEQSNLKSRKFCVFDKIEPEDVKQGNLDDCTFLATLSGIAERDMLAETSKLSLAGASVREMFLTQVVNTAGCYAVKFSLNGLDKQVVIDDFLPFKKDKKG